MSFASDLDRFVVRVKALPPAVLAGVTSRMHQSIVGTGAPDPLTGAPGQPVDTDTLRSSWLLAVTPSEGRITTNVAYARAIEDGIGPHGPLTLRSTVGGFHSVKLTVAGASAIQADVVRALTR